MRDSHYLILLKPFSSGFAAYRSNLQRNGNAIEIFDILGSECFHETLFNPKLQSFNGDKVYGYTTAYEPFVIIEDLPDGGRLVSGFDTDIFNELSKSLHAQPIVLAEELPYYYDRLYTNISGL